MAIKRNVEPKVQPEVTVPAHILPYLAPGQLVDIELLIARKDETDLAKLKGDVPEGHCSILVNIIGGTFASKLARTGEQPILVSGNVVNPLVGTIVITEDEYDVINNAMDELFVNSVKLTATISGCITHWVPVIKGTPTTSFYLTGAHLHNDLRRANPAKPEVDQAMVAGSVELAGSPFEVSQVEAKPKAKRALKVK